MRGTLLRRTDSVETPAARVLELETCAETATSERDHLRNMLTSLQKDLEQERIPEQSQEKRPAAPRREEGRTAQEDSSRRGLACVDIEDYKFERTSEKIV